MTDEINPPDDAPPKSTTGWYAGRTLSWPLFKAIAVAYWVLMGILSRLPMRKKVYRKMIESGYENLYRNTSGHFVVNTVYGDGAVVPRPATVDTDEQKVETDNDEYWTSTSGVETVRIGDAPVATGVADHHELVDPIAARLAEAVDYSPRRVQPVDEDDGGFRPVRLDHPLDDVAGGAGAGGQQAAQPRADGGVDMSQLSKGEVLDWVDRQAEALFQDRVRRQTTFADVWLDASNPEPENDGWIVSMKKAYEAHWDQAASEEMQKQEDRGRLAEMDPSKHRKQQLIMVLVAIGCFCLGLFGPGLASQIAGGAGGAVGGGLNLVVGPLLGVI